MPHCLLILCLNSFYDLTNLVTIFQNVSGGDLLHMEQVVMVMMIVLQQQNGNFKDHHFNKLVVKTHYPVIIHSHFFDTWVLQKMGKTY